MDMNNKFKFPKLIIIIAMVFSSAMLGGCQEDTTTQENTATLVTNSSNSIPVERIGLNGEFDSSGLAKRDAQAPSEDPIVQSVSTVYVAQNNSKIIFKGMVPDQEILDRLLTIAQNVSGVDDVDLSQVEIR